MIRALRAAVVLCFVAGPVLAEKVTDFTLPNGLQVVVIEDHRAPVVVHMVWYRVGAADEPPGHSGIAHFLEHLMFKGTDDVPPGKFSEIVQAQGGNDNAFTSWDYTISKNFKYNVSFSGTYQVKGSVLNYQVLTGGKILL